MFTALRLGFEVYRALGFRVSVSGFIAFVSKAKALSRGYEPRPWVLRALSRSE